MSEDWVQVTSQAEFQAALDAGSLNVELTRPVTVEIRVPAGVWAAVKSVSGALVRLVSGNVVARGSSHVVALESSHVEAWESSHVVALGSSHVVAWGSSHVVALESSHVVARESSHVVALESSHVVARESSHVVALGSSHVEARGSSHVEARGSSHVVALESSHVVALGSSSLAIVGDRVEAKASVQVAVQLHQGAECAGGVQITITLPRTSAEWCEYYGVKTEGEYAVLFKGVGDNFCSPHSANYTPGTETVAEDWDGGKRECGCGLHFSPHPVLTKEFNRGATKFIACLVPLAELAVHPAGEFPQKVKAQSCWNAYECDVHGNVIGAVHAKPGVTR